ncbi:SPOR domain-containing protein [Nitrosomonas marina]|uniref:Cell division protein FtsN n=1 Tax=Nitrosomonas marina TaxID=917 RepID=A0A1H8BR49_9PROT|nr:SPOR domain-containing protein [Nitrosomonas marina]SEM85029.1 Cell division protein FtsN [Nitrosomonas marina]
MSRDYKSRKSASSRSGKGALLLGIFIGYTLGIISAIGIWFYLEQAPSPFLTEHQISEHRGVHDDPDNSKGQDETIEARSENTAKVDEKLQFDFYNILPGDDESTLLDEPPLVTQEQPQIIEKPKPAPTPPVSLPQPIPAREKQIQPAQAITETYYLQVGSFRSNADADNLKARLAMLGVFASVQSADLSEKGIWYRVRVGPFTQKSRVDQMHHTLRENGIEAQFIKTQ